MGNKIVEKQIQDWLSNSGNVRLYQEGLEKLERSGLLTLMQRIGIPALLNYGESVNMMASQGSWSNGYQSAIEQLRYFVEIFTKKEEMKSIIPDFGGLEDALNRGLVKEEDIV